MSTQIKFDRMTNFTGRNGYFKCSGIEFMSLKHSNKVMLTPLTGKGAAARCDVTIPVENLQEFISELEKLLPQENQIANRMIQYLSNDYVECIELIPVLKKALEEDPDGDLDDVEGIVVWEKLEGQFLVNNFCEQVGIS